MKLKVWFTVAFSLVLFSAGAQDSAATRQLAEQYYADQNYQAALSAYQRLAFFSREQADPEVLFQIAGCFYQTGSPERALEYYDHAWFAAEDASFKNRCLFARVHTFLELRNYHSALAELLGMHVEEGSETWYRQQMYLGATWFGLEDYVQAGQFFVAAVPENRLALRRQVQELYAENKLFMRPDPRTARILSMIFPGSGQLYAGDPVSGLNSFLLTGVFVGLVVYLNIRTHPLEAIITGLPWFQRYYQGGFEQAGVAATKNREKRRNVLYQQTISLIRQAWED